MSALTDERLRHLLAGRAAAAPAMPLGDLARSATVVPQREPVLTLRGRIAITGLGAAAVVAIAVAGGMVARPSPVVGPPSAASSVAVSPSERPTTAVESWTPPSPEIRAWTALTWTSGGPESFASDANTSVMDTVSDGAGFIAVGFSAAKDGADVGRVWHTDDGRSWRSLAPPALAGLMPQRIVRVGDRLAVLAIKRGTDGTPSVLNLLASPDGIDWVPMPAPPVDVDRSVSLAVGGPLGLLIPTPDRTWLIGPDLAEWTSVARTETTPAPARGGLFAAGSARWFWLGATGSTASGAPPTVGAIWSSVDGRSWEPALIDRPGGVVSQIDQVDGGYVALGAEHGLRCDACLGGIDLSRVAWFSADGSTWVRLNVLGARNGDPLFAAMVSGDGHRLVAFANRFLTLVDKEPAGIVTQTVDGRTWSPVAVDGRGPRELTSLTVGSHGVVGFDHVDLGSGARLRIEPWWADAVTRP